MDELPGRGRSRHPKPDLPPGLAQNLRQKAGRELLELVQEHLRGFTLRELRQTLLNPHVTGEVIDEIALLRSLTTSYEVKRAIARHPKTPEQTALRFVAGLFWNDLLEIALDVRIASSVRHAAENQLLQRLERLAVGERITLARRAPARTQLHLREDSDPRVVQALLTNPRLTEEVVVRLAATCELPRVLAVVAKDKRWAPRTEVRSALARNTASPFQVILPILPTLPREVLEGIVLDQRQSSLIRHRAEDILAKKPAPAINAVWEIDPTFEVE